MNIRVKATNITLSPAISSYIDSRVGKALKLMGDDPSLQCDVEVARTVGGQRKGEIFKAEVHIVAAGKNIYASAEKEDLYAALDAVRDEVAREAKTVKGKRVSLVRRSGARMKDMVKGLWPWK